MVPETGYLTKSTTSPRQRQCNSRRRIQSDEGQVGLDVESNSFQQNETNSRNRNRFICIPTDHPTSKLFQLETRPMGQGNRCLSTGLVEHEDIHVCQPPMEFNRQSPNKLQLHQNTQMLLSGNSPLAITAMVPSTTGPINRPATPPSRVRDLNTGNMGGNTTRGNTQTNRVAYLKQSYSAQKISESASRLLLSSWREKSSKSYDSLFKRWVGWCEERDTDPITYPVKELVNFLADLHNKGYSYRSLNAYRSAISSTHDRVDGTTIGQHPLVCRLLLALFVSDIVKFVWRYTFKSWAT